VAEELSDFERAKMIVCLNLGIIPIDLNLKEELSKMEPEEARKLKRKFRKLKRKQLKWLEYVKFVSHKKYLAHQRVISDINFHAWRLLQGKGGANRLQDN